MKEFSNFIKLIREEFDFNIFEEISLSGLKLYHFKKFDKIFNKNQLADIFIIEVNYDLLKQYNNLSTDKSSDNGFYKLQEDLLADHYFEHESDLRWNMYLYFVYEGTYLLENINIVKIEEDDSYAVKLFISINDLLSFFIQTKDIWFFNYLNLGVYKGIMSVNSIIIAKWKNYIKNISLELQEKLMLMLNNLEFKIDVKETGFIKKIKSLHLLNYRSHCFPKAFELKFGQVNVFFGSNGTGKTSILEAIESSITGEIKRDEKNSDDDFKSTIVASVIEKKNNYFSTSYYSNMISYRKKLLLNKLWYNSVTINDESLNSNFNIYNFINSDMIYKFIYKETDYIKKFTNLLCDNNVLQIQEDINELREQYKEKLSSINDNSFRYNKEFISYKNDYTLLGNFPNISNLTKEFINKNQQKINELFKQIHRPREFDGIFINNKGELCTRRIISDEITTFNKMSMGQRASLAIATVLVMNAMNENMPRLLLLDEPIINFDTMHTIYFLNIVRTLAISGLQIFITTSDKDIAAYLRKLFSFMEDDFKLFIINREMHNNYYIEEKTYTPFKIKSKKIIIQIDELDLFRNELLHMSNSDFIENEKLFSQKITADNTLFPQTLSKEEEEMLIKEMINRKSEYARKKLLEHNLHLVDLVVKETGYTGRIADELMTAGTVGLIKAITTFEMKKGIELTTYAERCIKNEILLEIKGIKKAQIRDQYLTDFDIGENRSSGTVGSHYYQDPDYEKLRSNAPDIIDIISLANSTKILNKIIGDLNIKERTIIEKRYGLRDNIIITQNDIAKEMGISRSNVSRIEKKALKKLKESLKNNIWMGEEDNT